MTVYEIRILRRGQQPIVYSASLMSDHTAIRRARMLAQEGDFIEVWRGLSCVYSTVPEGVVAH